MSKIIELNKKEDLKLLPAEISDLTRKSLEVVINQPLEKLVFGLSESYITPYAVIAVSNSAKQIDAICSEVIKNLKDHGLFNTKIKIDGNGERGWCIIDLSDSLLHLITTEKLEKFKLEEIIKGNYQ